MTTSSEQMTQNSRCLCVRNIEFVSVCDSVLCVKQILLANAILFSYLHELAAYVGEWRNVKGNSHLSMSHRPTIYQSSIFPSFPPLPFLPCKLSKIGSELAISQPLIVREGHSRTYYRKFGRSTYSAIPNFPVL